MIAAEGALGFDVGGTNTRALVLGRRGEVLASREAATPRTPDDLVDLMASMVDQMTSEVGLARPRVGVGCAGTFDAAGTVKTSPNIPHLVGFALGERVSSRLGRPVVVENDATAAAWAEFEVGAGRDHSDLAFVSLGTGIGAGFVLGSRLHRGVWGAAGEAGHMTIVHGGLLCGCGRRGCWEQYGSGTAYGRLAREAVTAGRAPDVLAAAAGDPDEVTSHLVTELVVAQHPEALAILDELAHWIAVGVANLVNVLDPGLVVIGGGLSDIGDPLLDAIGRQYRAVTEPGGTAPVTISRTEVGTSGGAIGAALLAGRGSPATS